MEKVDMKSGETDITMMNAFLDVQSPEKTLIPNLFWENTIDSTEPYLSYLNGLTWKVNNYLFFIIFSIVHRQECPLVPRDRKIHVSNKAHNFLQLHRWVLAPKEVPLL